jgi:hypothetical protein
MKARFALGILLLTLGACDKPSEQPPPSKDDRLYGDERKAMEKAQGLEQQMQQDADERQRRIDEATHEP